MDKNKTTFQYDDLIKIIDYLPIAVGIADLKGNILKINKKSIKLFGYFRIIQNKLAIIYIGRVKYYMYTNSL